MPTSPPISTWAVAFLGCAFLIAGCGPVHSPAADATAAHPPNPDEDDVPITADDVKMPASYPEAVERIAGYCNEVRRAIEEKHPNRAHRPLDEMDIVLDRLPEIARDG
ncbi:MAG TPA: hypothetical protein VGX76_16035, partial [Pirellulales bacterium]|nr:hypothetical protein [Pirellulales bacterium]